MKKRASMLLFIFSFVYVLHLFLDFTSSFTPGLSTYAGGRMERRADAIVVLTGGTGRVDVGLELLRRGHGGVLILSGVDEDAEIDSIFPAGVSEVERLSIVLEKKSKSTYENAIEVKRFMEEKNLGSIVLLTSTYHMSRAHFLFKRLMPPEVGIETHPVNSPNFDIERWWRGRGIVIAAGEFFKYCWYYVRFGVEDVWG